MIRLVIADDEQIIRQGLLTINWEAAGVKVEGVAANGPEALDLVRKTKPHVLLTDIRMPGIGGIELAETIQEELPSTKIIFLTAYHDFDYAYAAVKMNVSDFILKPTDPSDIIASIEKTRERIKEDMERADHIDRMKRQLNEYRLLAEKEIMQAPEHPHREITQEILRYIAANYKNDITIASTAEAVHLSPGYLSRLLKKETGETFLEILTRVRMRHAILLLRDTNMMIYEIAQQVGFRDARYFSQIFREYYGVKPTDFRAQLFQEKR